MRNDLNHQACLSFSFSLYFVFLVYVFFFFFYLLWKKFKHFFFFFLSCTFFSAGQILTPDVLPLKVISDALAFHFLSSKNRQVTQLPSSFPLTLVSSQDESVCDWKACFLKYLFNVKTPKISQRDQRKRQERRDFHA